MEKLVLDDGILEIEVNGNGVLRFNPTDPNVYQRFLEVAKVLPELERKYVDEIEQAESEMEQTADTLKRMSAFDAEVKERLSEVFGRENDFDALLGGVNLMAVGHNGERVVTNLLKALAPYIENGIERYRAEHAEAAVSEAGRNRAQRRAQ